MPGRVPEFPAPLPQPSAGHALWASLRMTSVSLQEKRFIIIFIIIFIINIIESRTLARVRTASAASMAASMFVFQVRG